jgi:hypothetical protein
MHITSTQLDALVNAARATGEDHVVTQLADGTVIEIRLKPGFPPEPTHPIAILLHRLRGQRRANN